MVLKNFCYINKGDLHGVKVKKNIVYSLFFKGFNVGILLLLVHLTIHYLHATNYCIWVTLSSILIWITLFDIGLGNDLSNKLTKVLSLHDKKLAQSYISTTVDLLILAMGILSGKYKNFETNVAYTRNSSRGFKFKVLHYNNIVAKLSVATICEAIDSILKYDFYEEK